MSGYTHTAAADGQVGSAGSGRIARRAAVGAAGRILVEPGGRPAESGALEVAVDHHGYPPAGDLVTPQLEQPSRHPAAPPWLGRDRHPLEGRLERGGEVARGGRD